MIKNFPFYSKAFLLSVAAFTPLFFIAGCEDKPSPPNPDPEPTDTTVVQSDLITERPSYYPGFVPIAIPVDYHTPTPELDNITLSDAFVVTPALGGWDKVNWSKGNILIRPGNYVGWDDMIIPISGTEENPITVMYYDPSHGLKVEHGFDTDKESRAAIIEGIQIGDKRNANSHITISGLTLKGDNFIKDGAVVGGNGIFLTPGGDNIKIVNCYAYKWRGARLLGDRAVFQDNVVAGSLQVRGDHGGVGLYTTKEYGSYNCRIVGNQILDQNNLVGAPKDGIDAEQYQFVNGLVIADNDLYFTAESIYEENGVKWSCGGSAMDLKNGSNDPNNPVIITNNRIAFCYPNPEDKHCGDNNGKLGEGIIFHKDVRNVIVSDNKFYKVSRGIMIYDGEIRDMITENFAIVNNLFVDLQRYTIKGNPDATGYAIHTATNDVDIVYNSFIGCFGFLSYKDKMRTYVSGNRYIGRADKIPFTAKEITVSDNYISDVPDLELSDLIITWHKHTGSETLIIPNCVSGKDQLKAISEKYTTGQTADYLDGVWWR